MGDMSLTMSYFHTGIRTIIGAEAFHGPVRDGKEWDHLAMVIRHNLLLGCWLGGRANSIESNPYLIAPRRAELAIPSISVGPTIGVV